jgi:hypothetical protein
VRFHNGSGGSRRWLVLLGSAATLATGLIAAGSAQAATVDCKGKLGPDDGSSNSARSFEYSFACTSPQGNEEMPTQIDAYSIISTKEVIGFQADPLVFDTAGEVVPDEAFGCEGPIPGAGFGCNGKASLENTTVGSFELSDKPCSKRGRRSPFKAWLVVSSDKIKDDASHIKTSSEPFKLGGFKCPSLKKGKGHKGHKGGRRH